MQLLSVSVSYFALARARCVYSREVLTADIASLTWRLICRLVSSNYWCLINKKINKEGK